MPADGTVPLYGIYNGYATGTQSRGDYLTTPSDYEVRSALGAETVATRTIDGLGLGGALIDGQAYKVLKWAQSEPGSRIKITVTPSLGSIPFVFRSGDGRSRFNGGEWAEGIVLDALPPGTRQIRIEIEHPAVGGRSAYIARSDVEVTVASAGA